MNRMLTVLSITLVSILFLSLVPLQPSSGEGTGPTDIPPTRTNAKTIIVDREGLGDYTRIQDAINNADNGDTVFLNPGYYYEEIIIDREITLRGSGRNISVIRGPGGSNSKTVQVMSNNITILNLSVCENGYGIHIFKDKSTCNNIIIDNVMVNNTSIYGISSYFGSWWNSNITIINSFFLDNRYYNYIAGIEVKIINNIYFISNNHMGDSVALGSGSGKNITITNNNIIGNIKNSYVGIALNRLLNFKVYNNIIKNVSRGIDIKNEYQSNTFKSYLKDNIIENCSIGIDFLIDRVDEHKIITNIENNTIINSSTYGINIGADGWILKNQKIINSKGYGIYFNWAKKSCIIENCSIKNSKNSGILLSNVDYAYIRKNTLENNKKGIELYKSTKCNIYNNTIINNGLGIETTETSENIIGYNQFINNTKQANTDSFDRWNFQYPSGGNYWSDYVGRDVKRGGMQSLPGSDGYGDSVYYINQSSWVRDLYPLFRDIVPPVAIPPDDILLDQGSIYHFDSTASTDDQLVHRVRWEFDYGGEHRVLTEKEFDFKFDLAGHYPINLTVYDFPGNSDMDSFNITVKDITNPIALTQGDITINQGELALFNASLSSDNSGITNYTWTFKYDDEFLELYGKTKSFRFVIPGIYQVKLRVTDTADRFSETNFNVTVIDTESPIADAGPDIEIDNGETADFGLSLSTDNGVIANYTWSFIYEGQMIRLFGPSNSFVFDRPGHYKVELNVTDQFGNFDIDDLLVTVVDTIPPNAIINGSLFQDTGEMIKLNGLDSIDNGFITRYLWEFSDGDPLTFEGPYLNKTFQRKGEHNVTLTVFDQWNNSDSATVTIEVLDKERPKASAGDDATIPAGTTFTFNASGSTDDGTIVSYLWIFEYGEVEKRLDGATAQFTFEKGGTFNVLLRVTDQSGNWGEDGLILTVVEMGVLKGTVLDKGGNPLKGGKVTVRASDGRDYLGISSANGSFVIDVFMGEATYTITLPGYRSVSGTVTIKPMQTTVLETSRTTMEKEENSSEIAIVPIIIGFILLPIIVTLILFILLRKKKGKTEGGSEEEPKETIQELPPDGDLATTETPREGITEEIPIDIPENEQNPFKQEESAEGIGPADGKMDEFFSEIENNVEGVDTPLDESK